MTKLDWEYQDRARVPEYRAEYKGIVIRAIHDDCPDNPFTNSDCYWPMLALPCERTDRVTEYDDVPGLALGAVLGRFNDAALIHDQKAIGAALEVSDADFQDVIDDDTPLRKWWTDASTLRECFENVLHQHDDQRARLEILAELYKLLGIPCLCTTVRGYCQGDQTDLLIVATPEAREKFGTPADVSPEDMARDLENQAKLYKAWAFGDVYGFQLARKVAVTTCTFCRHVHEGTETDTCEQCGEDTYSELELVDIEEGDTSCWGFYGDDFDWSGLEEAAMDAVDYLVKEQADA